MLVAAVAAQGVKMFDEAGVGSPELGGFLHESTAARAAKASHALIDTDLNDLRIAFNFLPTRKAPKC